MTADQMVDAACHILAFMLGAYLFMMWCVGMWMGRIFAPDLGIRSWPLHVAGLCGVAIMAGVVFL